MQAIKEDTKELKEIIEHMRLCPFTREGALFIKRLESKVYQLEKDSSLHS